MKMLHVTPVYEPNFESGGVVMSISRVSKALVQLGHDVTVFTTNGAYVGERPDVQLSKPVDVGGVSVWYFNTPLSRMFMYSRDLAKMMSRKIEEFDVVHISSMWAYPAIPAARAALQAGIPYVISPRGMLIPGEVHNHWMRKKVYLHLVERHIFKHASALHLTSQLESDQTQYPWLPQTRTVIPSPIALDEFATVPSRTESRQSLGIPTESFVVAYVGRLHQRKALDILIEGVALLQTQLAVQISLVLAGPDDGDAERLKALGANLGISEQIQFLGYVDARDRNRVLASADIFWLASYAGENFGISGVESLAAGVPLLVSENTGIGPEVVRWNAGKLVDLNARSVANTLKEFVYDRGAASMKQQAYELAKNYDKRKVACEMADFYETIISNHQASKAVANKAFSVQC